MLELQDEPVRPVDFPGRDIGSRTALALLAVDADLALALGDSREGLAGARRVAGLGLRPHRTVANAVRAIVVATVGGGGHGEQEGNGDRCEEWADHVDLLASDGGNRTRASCYPYDSTIPPVRLTRKSSGFACVVRPGATNGCCRGSIALPQGKKVGISHHERTGPADCSAGPGSYRFGERLIGSRPAVNSPRPRPRSRRRQRRAARSSRPHCLPPPPARPRGTWHRRWRPAPARPRRPG